jgi:hypothetical protein
MLDDDKKKAELIEYWKGVVAKHPTTRAAALKAGAEGTEPYEVKFHELTGDKARATVQASVKAGALDAHYKQFILDPKKKNDVANAKDYGTEMSREPEPDMSMEPKPTPKKQQSRTYREYVKMGKMLTGLGFDIPSGERARREHINKMVKTAGIKPKGWGHLSRMLQKAYTGPTKYAAKYKGTNVPSTAPAAKPMSGDPEPDELDYQDRRGRVRDAKPGELPPKITPQQRRNLGRE